MIFPGVGSQWLNARTSRHFTKVMSDSAPAITQAKPTSRILISNSPPMPNGCRRLQIDIKAAAMSICDLIALS